MATRPQSWRTVVLWSSTVVVIVGLLFFPPVQRAWTSVLQPVHRWSVWLHERWHVPGATTSLEADNRALRQQVARLSLQLTAAQERQQTAQQLAQLQQY